MPGRRMTNDELAEVYHRYHDMVYRIAAYFNLLIPDVFPLAKEIHLASYEECIKK